MNIMKIKKYTMFFVMSIIISIFSNVQAASSNINASSTNVTVGAGASINVSINAASWNIHVSGAGITDSIVGYDADANNTEVNKSYALNTSKAGSYTVSISGDITDANGTNLDINKSITVVVTQPTSAPATQTNTANKNTTTQTPTTKSSNANLRTLVPEVEGLTPSFNPNITNYTLTVPSTVTNLNMSVSVEQSGAKYWIEGDENLQLGNNTVTVTVTAPSGAKKTYTIIVTKAEDTQKANALLNSMIIEGYELSPEFSSEVFDYDIGKVGVDIEKLNILTFAASDKAKVEIQGNETLLEGENTVKVVVTAEDGTTKKEYNIKYNKEVKPIVEDENNALETINEEEIVNQNEENSSTSQLEKAIKDNELLLLMYLVVLVEFVQIIYLYRELKKRDLQKEDNFDRFNIKLDDIEENNKIEEQVEPELEESQKEQELLDELPNIDEIEKNVEESEEHIQKNPQEDIKEEIENDFEVTSKIRTIWDDDKPDFSEELNNASEEETITRVRGGRKSKK